MAIDTLVPVANSVVEPGDSISFIVDDTYTTMQILVTLESGSEYAYDGALGGAQAGYTVSVTNSGGRDTFVVTRSAGWNISPQQVSVIENETGSSATTTTSYYLTNEHPYPQEANPYNAESTGTLLVSEDSVIITQDVNQLDFDDATFNVTDLGSGKTRIVSVTGSGDVVGPAGATDDAIVVYDGATGKLVKDSTGTIAQITANTAKVTNATHTGDVTGDAALTIAAKAVDVAMLADGTDGELITWDSSGVAAVVAVGTATHVLTSNGVGVAPTFQAASGGGGGPSGLGEWRYSTSTTEADPGSGNFRLDAVPASATFMYLDDVNRGGVDMSTIINALFAAGDYIYLQEGSDATNAYLYEIDTAGAVDQTGWFKIALIFKDAGTGSISNNDDLALVHFSSAAGTDSDAIHDNVAGEIAAVTAKGAPVAGDFLLIEDSAAANAKKSITMADIDHDALTNFVTAEHVDWAGAGAGTIHTDNYIENATHTGDVTGSGVLTIAAKAVDVAMLADGTDGELITWDTSGVAATVAVGTATHVLTSNGVGVAPTFQAPTGGGDVTGGSASADNEVVTYNSTTGKIIQRSNFKFGDASPTVGTRTLGAVANIAGGHIITGGSIVSSGTATTAMGLVSQISGTASITSSGTGAALANGYALSLTGTATILSSGLGSVVLGYCSMFGAGTSTLQCTTQGGFAGGLADGASIIEGISNAHGCFVHGYSSAGGIIRVTGALGGFASGSSFGAGTSIIVSGDGGFGTGACTSSGDIAISGDGAFGGGLAVTNAITSSNDGTFAWGDSTSGAITASAAGAAQFGVGVNAVANSLQVGDTTDGLRLISGGTTSTNAGSFWVNGSSQVVMRSASQDHTFSHPTVSGSTAGNAALQNLLSALDTMNIINDTTT